MHFVTTGLVKYWEKNSELLLAGKWCEIDNKIYLDNHKYKYHVLKYPWNVHNTTPNP